ncbi:MAG: chromate efflux transporter [Solirubrobacteraceae bacterium]|nr:chromate efflux transporter [Patulibacter sp.]
MDRTTAPAVSAPPLRRIARDWGRIGCLGFGGPPAHVAMLRELCVERRRWIDDTTFEHDVATTNLLPGPGSTQLAILCAWRLRGGPGALVGGLAFILPGLVLIIALAAVFLGSPPPWIRGIGAGAGAAVVAVALHAGAALVPASASRTRGWSRVRWSAYVVAGAAAAATLGAWLVLVLIACGVLERLVRHGMPTALGDLTGGIPLAMLVTSAGGLGALSWTAFKVGALSYGGGFVIVPLMQGDAVAHHHWLTKPEFLDAVALGQATPGPVVHTVAAVGYAAHGIGGALLAAVVAFAPSFSFVLIGAGRLERWRDAPGPRAFLLGAGPAAIGAMLGSAVPLAAGLHAAWQVAVVVAAAGLLFVARRGVVSAIALGAVAGLSAAALGAPLH